MKKKDTPSGLRGCSKGFTSDIKIKPKRSEIAIIADNEKEIINFFHVLELKCFIFVL